MNWRLGRVHRGTDARGPRFAAGPTHGRIDRLEQFITEQPDFVEPRRQLAQQMTAFEWAQVVAFDGPELPALTVDDLDVILETIAASGWKAAGEPQTLTVGPNAGKRVVYVRDPDGTTIEFMQPP